MLNAVNYLLNDDGLLDIRTKNISIAFLDEQKINDNKAQWQLLTIALPLAFLAVFGVIFNYIRRKKYA